MENKEYSLNNGYICITENDGVFSVVYNKLLNKCMCLTTGCEFDFNGNDKLTMEEHEKIAGCAHGAVIFAMRKHYGIEGKMHFVSFRELLYAFAPDLRRTNFFNKTFTAKELENIEPTIINVMKKINKMYGYYVDEGLENGV